VPRPATGLRSADPHPDTRRRVARISVWHESDTLLSEKAIVELKIAISLMNTDNRRAISLKKLPASANAS